MNKQQALEGFWLQMTVAMTENLTGPWNTPVL
jgi:hypothetical protein